MSKNDIKSYMKNNKFLISIRGQIGLLRYVVIGSLIILGLLIVFTTSMSYKNNSILYQMNIISNLQHEINSIDESNYKNDEYVTLIKNDFIAMKSAADIALTIVDSPSTKNDLRNLKRDVERLMDNYEKHIRMSKERGYTANQGLYWNYSSNSAELYSSISSMASVVLPENTKLPNMANHLENLYKLSTLVADYTTQVLDDHQGTMNYWQIYGIMRTLERETDSDYRSIKDNPLIPEHIKKNYLSITKKLMENRTIISKMISIDKEFISIHNNNRLLFDHLLSISDRIKISEKTNTGSEQELLLMFIAILTLVLITYVIIHTIFLRRDLSKSVLVFDKLMEAKNANDAQTSFLSTVSHEIRTPINAIMGMNEIIIRESENKQIERYALEIKDSSRTLLSLVNDLLDSSRLDADRLKIIPVEYDLASSISDLANMISSRVREKNLNFFVNVDEELPHMLFGDEIRIKQCVLNLLTNAVKYTESGSITMNVGFDVVNRGSIILKFQVIDTGIGMKEDDLAHLFDRFSRFEEKKNRNIEGTGLGMNIVNRLLALMGTNLEVHSIYGKGSDFSFGVHQGVINWAPLGDYNAMYEKSIIAQRKYHEKLRAPAARLLIVDDMQVNLTVFKGLLKKTEIQIDAALSGKTAIEMIKKNTYDMVFLDHRMPKMDGIETLINIKELNNNPNRNIPYIALTANAIAGARELYINAGFTDYLSKPIDSTELENLLIEYLPKELVELRNASDNDYDEKESDTEESEYEPGSSASADNEKAKNDKENELHSILKNLEGIDYASAIENCIDDETLSEAISDFIQSLETKPAEIERYWRDKDYRNYTVQVHALKSTARLIGAKQLGEDAYYLEQCGDAENETAINEKTDALLDLYESYGQKLKPYSEFMSKSEESDSSDGDLPDEMFADAMRSAKELVDSFDFGNAEEVLKMLKNYNLSCEQQSKYDIIYKMIRNVDRDSVLAWFDEHPDV